jgi:hypothetical protein
MNEINARMRTVIEECLKRMGVDRTDFAPHLPRIVQQEEVVQAVADELKSRNLLTEGDDGDLPAKQGGAAEGVQALGLFETILGCLQLMGFSDLNKIRRGQIVRLLLDGQILQAIEEELKREAPSETDEFTLLPDDSKVEDPVLTGTSVGGLLDMSLANDDTVTGNPAEPEPGEPKLDEDLSLAGTNPGGSGLLDLSKDADDSQMGNIFEGLDIPELKEPEAPADIPEKIDVPEPEPETLPVYTPAPLSIACKEERHPVLNLCLCVGAVAMVVTAVILIGGKWPPF